MGPKLTIVAPGTGLTPGREVAPEVRGETPEGGWKGWLLIPVGVRFPCRGKPFIIRVMFIGAIAGKERKRMVG